MYARIGIGHYTTFVLMLFRQQGEDEVVIRCV